jgi:hypothetical protein
VTVPDASRFVQLETTPPLAVVWVSQDETIKLGVSIIQLPRRMELIQASVEEGMAEEMHGRIVESSKSQLDGHQVFTMTATGDVAGSSVHITQSVVAIGDKVYKAMAIGIGKDTRTLSDARDFIGSFKILASAEKTPPTAKKVRQAENESMVDLLSEKIGGISLLLLLSCAVVALWSRFSKKRATKQR